MDVVVPFPEKMGLTMAIDPHPGDFVEDGRTTINVLRKIGSNSVKFLYSAPHTFFMGGDIKGIMQSAGSDMVVVRVADTFDHRLPVRYIVNPIGAKVAVHQHLNIGEGELDWDLFFGSLAEAGYDGPINVSVFAWPDRVEHSASSMRETIQSYATKFNLSLS
jgi:myo-inositol catabolism protein IolH